MNMNYKYAKRSRKNKRKGMTLVEIMIVVIIMAMIAAAVGIAVIPALNDAKVKATRTDAMTLRSAVELYVAGGGNDCPSVQDLVSGHIVNASTRTKDAWDHDFVIECRGDEFTVSSHGPDGQGGTEDDISTN